MHFHAGRVGKKNKNIKEEEKEGGGKKGKGASGDLLERQCGHITPPMGNRILFLLWCEELAENPQLAVI